LFNVPGIPDIELIDNGLETLLTIYNIEEYVTAIFDKLLGRGVSPLIAAFRNAFNLVFDINNLKCFFTNEIQDSLCGSFDEKWDQDYLYEYIKPDHGYDKSSAIYNYLIKYMMEIDKFNKKKFLLFVTGSPRLPIGGMYI
jgi:E3 ubiquitin-protein ligase TRIP12